MSNFRNILTSIKLKAIGQTHTFKNYHVAKVSWKKALHISCFLSNNVALIRLDRLSYICIFRRGKRWITTGTYKPLQRLCHNYEPTWKTTKVSESVNSKYHYDKVYIIQWCRAPSVFHQAPHTLWTEPVAAISRPNIRKRTNNSAEICGKKN